MNRTKKAKQAVSNVIVVMLSLVLVVIVVGNVILWSYQMNQFDWERTQENLDILSASRATASSWFTAQNEFAITQGSRTGGSYQDTKAQGGSHETFMEEANETAQVFHPSAYNTFSGTTHLSGTLPDLQTNDGTYMTFRSYASATSPPIDFHPSNYAPLGSTEYVSGLLTNLQIDDGDYMTFRSYITSKSDAFITYRGITGMGDNPLYPKSRIWNGSSVVWGSENVMPIASAPIDWVRTAVCPKSERALEKIVATSTDGYNLNAYVWNGTSWTVTNIASMYPLRDWRFFDVAYEKDSGRALLVYSRGTTTNEIGYKIWTFGSGWSSEYLLDLPYTTGKAYWICLASAPGTRSGTADDNEMAMIYMDQNKDVHGYVWTGSSWSLMGATTVWDDTAATETKECLAVAYEQTSGRAMFIWSDATSTDFYYRIWDGSTLSVPTLLDIAAAGGVGNWVTLKSNPINNELLFTEIDAASNLNTAYWSGSAWTVHTEHDDAIDTNGQRCVDFAWEPTGSKGLLVWGTTAGYIAYRNFTAPNTWGSITNVAMGANIHPWIQLRTNPRNINGDVKILGAVLETANYLGAIKWNGTTFTVIGASTFTAQTTIMWCECFEIEFMNFGAPTEFTSEVVFTGTSNTKSWTQLSWTIDGGSTIADANATFQLYNYQTGQYPTNGDGYMNGTIGTSDVTLSQNITVNPTYFRDSGGNWTMKITIVKATAEQFDWRGDLVRFANEYPTEFTCEVEFTGTANTQNWTQLTWMVDSALTADNVNVTLQLYNNTAGSYSTSGDGYITYVSSAINGTDQTYDQTITANMTDFRDSDGNWRIKIVGVKTSDTQFDLSVDLVELSAEPVRTYRLCISNTFTIDLLEYPPSHIRGIQISIRYNVTEDTEKWFLEAYNWAASSFSHVGFNDTDGHQSTRNSWNEFTISVTDDWADYMQGNSTLIEFYDEGLPANQTVVEIDFLGVTPLIDGVRLELRNMGSLTTHVVSLWILNSTSHQRYDANVFMNSGEEKTYVNMDVILPEDDFVVKVVTERGNIAVAPGS